ncbi:MAG TPA: proton-conducting transporter membrane subunit, partial [Bdellovibrionota bacterium]|nr:proton-conducting transporter membrane subunit [Bdellovibrionota bacterium]
MNEFLAMLPEVFLALTLMAVIVGEITYHGERLRLIVPIALLGLAVTLAQTVLAFQNPAAQVLSRSIAIDGISLFFKLLFIVLAILSIIGSTHTKEIPEGKRAEFVALVVASTLAMGLVAAAADLMLAFLALQFMNLIAYFLAGYSKRSMLSTEAAVKYMAFCAVSGALFVYGLAILFAHSHSLNMYEIHRALSDSPLPHGKTLVIFGLIFISFTFQMAAFPMYLWTPDVLEGSPTPVSSFISIGTRAAGFALALRFLIIVFAKATGEAGRWEVLGPLEWTRIVAWVSGLSMAIGGLLAYRQVAAKRMVGYLIVASSGFMLLGILVLDEIGVGALLYNLVIELFALIGIFYVLSFYHDELGSDRLTDLRGMLRRSALESVFLVIFLLCLVGLPPTPGFIGKFALVGVAVRHQWPILAAVAIGS